MKLRTRLIVFVSAFLITFFYWRVKVFFFVGDDEVPWIREVTGLTIHHFHYGLIFITIASLLLIFFEINWFSVGLMGIGLSTALDSFISRMMNFSSVRANEIATYNNSFIFTLIFFLDVILLAVIFYLIRER